MGDWRGAYRVLVVKPDGRKPLGTSRRRGQKNIKVDPTDVAWGGGMDWIDLAEDRDR
jgi:hypothetical protein